MGDFSEFEFKGFDGAPDLAGLSEEVQPSELGTHIDFVNATIVQTSRGGEAIGDPKFFKRIENLISLANDSGQMPEAKARLIGEIDSVRVQLAAYLLSNGQDLETALKSALGMIHFANEKVSDLDDEMYYENLEYTVNQAFEDVDLVEKRLGEDISRQIKKFCMNPVAFKILERWEHHPLKYPFGQIVKPNDACFNRALRETAVAIMNGELSNGDNQKGHDRFTLRCRHLFYQNLYRQLNERQQKRLRMLISDSVLIWQLVGHLSSDSSIGSPAVWLTKNAQLPRPWEGSNKNKLWKEQNARDRIDQLIETWSLLCSNPDVIGWVLVSSELRGFVPQRVLLESIEGFVEGTWSGKAGRYKPKLREVKSWCCTFCNTEFENGDKLHKSPLPRKDLVVENELPSLASEFARAMCAKTVEDHQCWEHGGVLVPKFLKAKTES